MSKYIDATDIAKQIADFKRVVNSPNSDYMTGYLCALSVTEGMIDNTPTADVVAVVRCKDCIYYKSNCCFNRQWDFESSVEVPMVRENDFCSYGERGK